MAYVKGNQALLMELNSETDFAAKEPEFLKTARRIADVILSATPRPASKEEILSTSSFNLRQSFPSSSL